MSKPCWEAHEELAMIAHLTGMPVVITVVPGSDVEVVADTPWGDRKLLGRASSLEGAVESALHEARRLYPRGAKK